MCHWESSRQARSGQEPRRCPERERERESDAVPVIMTTNHKMQPRMRSRSASRLFPGKRISPNGSETKGERECQRANNRERARERKRECVGESEKTLPRRGLIHALHAPSARNENENETELASGRKTKVLSAKC